MVPTMNRRSLDEWLASAAGVAQGSVQQQYHLELLQCPASSNVTTKPGSYVLSQTPVILHLHTSIAQINIKNQYKCLLKLQSKKTNGLILRSDTLVYTPYPEKKSLEYFRHNFIKSWPIFEILLQSQSAENLQ